MKLTYPALFSPWENGDGYTVEFPDLPGCVTEGATMTEAIEMAVDAASGWVLGELEDGNAVPPASNPAIIRAEGGTFVSVVVLDMDVYAEKYGSKSIRKNLTIPAWLNTFAEKQRINFSQVLSDALTTIYQQQTQVQ